MSFEDELRQIHTKEQAIDYLRALPEGGTVLMVADWDETEGDELLNKTLYTWFGNNRGVSTADALTLAMKFIFWIMKDV